MLSKRAASPISDNKIGGIESVVSRNRATNACLLPFFSGNENFGNIFFEIVVKIKDFKKSGDMG